MGINAYGGISEAKFSEGGTYVLPGVYRFKVLACKHINMRTGKQAFVVELEILESTNADRMPGTTCSWMVTLDKEPALGNIKQFVTVAAPCNENQVNEAAILLIVGEQNPLKGRVLRCSATEITTKAGRPFTKVKWLEDKVGASGAAAEAATA
jgi:hypothetical protein